MTEPQAQELRRRLEETAATLRARVQSLTEDRLATETRADELTARLRQRWQRLTEAITTRTNADGASRALNNG